ncbi:MAG: hypothetical protein L7V87_07180, partial [Verrucomicrobiales bacterium]|nr:hypothetical protein [Verrucomicrobiales bacterium]
VQVGFRHAGNKEAEIIGWEFKVDLLADYISSEVTKPGSNETMDKPTVEPKEEVEETPTASL